MWDVLRSVYAGKKRALVCVDLYIYIKYNRVSYRHPEKAPENAATEVTEYTVTIPYLMTGSEWLAVSAEKEEISTKTTSEYVD